MSRQPWLDSELSAAAALRQAARLGRAGFARPWLTLLLSASLASALLGALVLAGRQYAPSFALRVVEAEHPSGNAPPLKRQLAEYLRQAVFTSEPLLSIMRRHGLYTALARKNPRAALESFKEDITVDVYENYFLEDRMLGDEPRSARLTVSFHSKDPQAALAVTRELGQLIVQHELSARRDQTQAAAESAKQERDILLNALQQRSSEVLDRQRQIHESVSPDSRRQVELVSLLGSLPALERQVDAAERRTARLDLGAALERGGIGLRFEVVDEAALPSRAERVRSMVMASAATFVCGLPLIAMAVGAFSRPSPRGQR